MAGIDDHPSKSATLTAEECHEYELWWKLVTDPSPADVITALRRIIRATP